MKRTNPGSIMRLVTIQTIFIHRKEVGRYKVDRTRYNWNHSRCWGFTANKDLNKERELKQHLI